MKRTRKTWFTSDTHFGHRAIIDMCGRPFADVDEMDDAMVAAWNAVVHTNDVVWHLGDFAFRCHPQRAKEIFDALNGIKHLVVGNHDKKPTLALGWAEVIPFRHLVVDGVQINLSHYAMRVWPGLHRGAVMLYGHSHGTLPGSRATLDVGVDNVGFAPVDLPEILGRMAALPRVAYDQGRVVEPGPDDEPALAV
jgi:calcineurin-like phosphoesterase family protein